MLEFNISRPTLREAVRILESEGLITVRRGARGGAKVQEPSAAVAARYAGLVLQHRNVDLDDVLTARVVVEAPAARTLAARRDRVTSANRLQACLDSFQRGGASRFHEFNALVVELAGNETLVLLTAMLEHISQLATMSFMMEHHPEEQSLARSAQRARQKLIDHIRAGDAEAADRLWRAHLSESGRWLTKGSGAATIVDLYG